MVRGDRTVNHEEMTGAMHPGAAATRDLARVQIYKHVTRDRVLDISDMLSLETRRSKIAFTLLEFDENYRATTRVRHYADTGDFKLVCWDILHGGFAEWTDHKGSPSPSGDLQARVLTLRKDVKYRQPYVLKIDNGVGESMESARNGGSPKPGFGGSAPGAVRMAQATDSLTLLMPEWDARRMAQTVLDYIRDWETIHFRKRQEAQTVILPAPSAEYGGIASAPAAMASAAAVVAAPAESAAARRRGTRSPAGVA
jgi:hypothetical protein